MFPQYLDVFCNVTGVTSLMILKEYSTPDKTLRGHKNAMIQKISKASRKGHMQAGIKYNKLVKAANNGLFSPRSECLEGVGLPCQEVRRINAVRNNN